MSSEQKQPKLIKAKINDQSKSHHRGSAPGDGPLVSKYKQLLLEGHQIPTNNVKVLQELVQNIQNDRKNALLNDDMRKALDADKMLKQAKGYLIEAQKLQLQRKEQRINQKQGEEVQSRIATYDDETIKEIKELKKQLMLQRQQVIENCNKEVEALEKLWHSEEHKRKYNRPSDALRTTLSQAKKLLSVGRNEEAQIEMKYAKELQEKEMRDNSFQMQKDYENALQLLNNKIQDQIHTFDVKAQLQIDKLRSSRQGHRTIYENQMKKIENRAEDISDPDHCWNVTQKQRITEKVYENKDNNIVLPKTFRQLEREIKRPDNIFLDIEEVDEKRDIIKPIPSPNFE